MVNLSKYNKKLVFILGSLVGLVVFLYIYGTEYLNPFNTEWIYYTGADTIVPYLGWEYWRKEDIAFPYGMIKSIVYPFSTTIVYTDSIPLFAFLFRIVNLFFKGDFQYIGIWALCCFMLNGALGALIVHRYVKNIYYCASASIFFATAYPLICRMFGHSALGGQWIILLAICLCIWEFCIDKFVYRLICWCAICVMATLIHPYLLLMTGAIMAASVLLGMLKKKEYGKNILILISSVLCSCITFWIEGGLHNAGGNLNGGCLRLASFNLLSFFSTTGSKIIPDLPHSDIIFWGEGSQYLGCSIILLLPITIVWYVVSFIKESNKTWALKNVLVYSIVSFALLILALSPQIWLGDKVLLEYSIPNWLEGLWGTFQSSGRLMWPVYYTIIAAVLIALGQMLEKISFTRILRNGIFFVAPIALFIFQQWGDNGGILMQQKKTFENLYNRERLESLDNPFWHDALETVDEVDFIMPWDLISPIPVEAIAYKYEVQLSAAYTARLPMDEMTIYANNIYLDILNGELKDNTLYILNYEPMATELYAKYLEDETVCIIVVDNYVVLFLDEMLDVDLYTNIQNAKELSIEEYKELFN